MLATRRAKTLPSSFEQVVPFQEKYQNIMVSVNDAMEHSNVSSFLQFAFCILLFTYTFIARPEVLVKSMNGNKKKIAIL